MNVSNVRIFCVLLVLFAGNGCVHHVEAGLANAQSVQRQNQPRHDHDAISNGPDALTAARPPHGP